MRVCALKGPIPIFGCGAFMEVLKKKKNSNFRGFETDLRYWSTGPFLPSVNYSSVSVDNSSESKSIFSLLEP